MEVSLQSLNGFRAPCMCAKSLRLCPTLQLYGPWPARLLCPWDSPGKNTEVGCHFLLQCIKVKSEVAQLCPTLSHPMDCSPPGSSVHGISRQEYWSGVPLPSPSRQLDLPKSEVEPPHQRSQDQVLGGASQEGAARAEWGSGCWSSQK